jgi:hypothetical protein
MINIIKIVFFIWNDVYVYKYEDIDKYYAITNQQFYLHYYYIWS